MKIQIGKSIDENANFHLVPDENLYTGKSKFIDLYTNLSSLEIDLLNLAAGIYASDLAVKRKEREEFIRNIELNIEVVNYHAFERVKNRLENALFLISKDNWRINFQQIEGSLTSNLNWNFNEGVALLFSGGLDSYCAASELLKNDDNVNICLISHVTHGNKIVASSQNQLCEILKNYYNKSFRHFPIKTYARRKGNFSFPEVEDRENTQRTRSFLFLVLASIIAYHEGLNKILYIAENGQFAIHIPLNSSRVGPFSTHTADPEFLHQIQDVLRILLNNIELEIFNPFLYMTKAEVVGLLPPELLEGSNRTITCWKISRTQIHCGECIPCISRRIALEFNNKKFDEYHIDLFNQNLDSLSDDNIGKRNIIDYIEFINSFSKFNNSDSTSIAIEFPELFSSYFNIDKAVNMYRRLVSQSISVFNNYPTLVKVMK